MSAVYFIQCCFFRNYTKLTMLTLKAYIGERKKISGKSKKKLQLGKRLGPLRLGPLKLGPLRLESDALLSCANLASLVRIRLFRIIYTGVFPKCFQRIQWIQWQKICHYSKRVRTCILLFERPGCYHRASKTHVRERIFKLTPIHASGIYQIPWIRRIQWKFCTI